MCDCIRNGTIIKSVHHILPVLPPLGKYSMSEPIKEISRKTHIIWKERGIEGSISALESDTIWMKHFLFFTAIHT